jgi:hypothetical protein
MNAASAEYAAPSSSAQRLPRLIRQKSRAPRFCPAYVAKAALKRGTGARGLRAEMERLMTEIMYEAPGNDAMKKVVITAKTIKERLGIDETDVA